MINPGILYLLLTALLLAIAIYSHVSSTALSLPNAPGISLITILLPLAASANAFFYPRLLHSARNAQVRLEHLLPTILQILQGILTTVLATVLLQDTVPGTVLECGLSTQWMSLYRTHSGEAIRKIQDALDCCGYHTVKDRSWPFPADGVNRAQCSVTFHRDQACAGPWRAVMQRNSGLDLAVVLGVAMLQIATVFLSTSASSWRRTWWAQGWRRLGVEDHGHSGSARPLLEAPEARVEEEHDESEGGEEDSPQYRYGTVRNGNGGNGLRVEPSTLERNAWQDGD